MLIAVCDQTHYMLILCHNSEKNHTYEVLVFD